MGGGQVLHPYKVNSSKMLLNLHATLMPYSGMFFLANHFSSYCLLQSTFDIIYLLDLIFPSIWENKMNTIFQNKFLYFSLRYFICLVICTVVSSYFAVLTAVLTVNCVSLVKSSLQLFYLRGRHLNKLYEGSYIYMFHFVPWDNENRYKEKI